MKDRNYIFDVKKVERQIELAMHTPIPPLDFTSTREEYAPRPIDYGSMPAITNEVPISSAEQVALQYEAAALEVEAMGVELKDAAQRAVDMADKISDALKYVADTAAAYRSEARLIFDRIEKVSEMANAVIETCAELKEKMVTDTQINTQEMT